MPKLLKIAGIFCFCLLGLQGMAQTDTTGRKPKIRPLYLSLSNFEKMDTKLSAFDTSLNQFQQFNPYLKRYMGYQDLGTPGTPIKGLFLTPTQAPGFHTGFRTLDPWMFDHQGRDERIVVAQTPYTNLNYTQGEKELIILEATHLRNITQRWNAGLDYRRVKSNNYLYFNLAGNSPTTVRIPSIYNLRVFSSYRSKGDRYYLIGSIVYNKSTLRETGGLLDTEAFDTTSGKRRSFENPLNNASNLTNQPAIWLKHYYRFGKYRYNTTSNGEKTDTTGKEFIPRGYFYHSFHASRTLWCYKDATADTPYYPHPIFDTETNDSMVLKELTHQAGMVVKTTYRSFSNTLHAGTELSNIGVFNSHYGQLGYFNLSLKGDIHSQLKRPAGLLEIRGNGQWFPVGYNQGDYLFKASANIVFRQKLGLTGRLFGQKHQADQFQNTGFTNFIVWDQKLSPTTRAGQGVYLSWLPLNLNLGYTSTFFRNFYLYYAGKAPAGIDFIYNTLYLSHELRAGHFGWNNQLTWQHVSETYHLPQWTLNGGIYHEYTYFKKNMLARVGIDYYWFSSFHADAYVPYLRQFVWQDQVRVGGYPYVDVYLSATIQTVNLYLRFEHLNQGFSGNRYYLTPGYPVNPRFFRLGINWRMFN